MKRFLLSLLVFTSIAQAAPEIHPGMLETIQANEGQIRETGFIKNPNQIIVDGQVQFTGFNPTAEVYVDADYIEINVPDDWEMKEIDYTALASSPVLKQTDGSCWAQGARTCMNLAWNSRYGYTPGHPKALDFSPQDVIDCSGYGTARRGGSLSLAYAVKAGLAYFGLYPYVGGDGKCKKDIERHNKLERAPMVRGKGGAFPNEKEVNYALWTIGPFEVCGSSRAMKSGGWVENPGGGSTDHCYGHAGMRWGPKWGKVAAWFHGMLNSWGTKWGAEPAGAGWYKLASTPGGSLKNQRIMTEMQVAVTGLPLFQPGPVKFGMSGPKGTFQVTVQPGKFNADNVKKALKRAGYKEEASK